MKFREESPGLNKSIEPPREDAPIETYANFEGHDTELLFKRISNPEINKQIIDLIEKSQNDNNKFLTDYKDKKTIEEELDQRFRQAQNSTPINIKESSDLINTKGIGLNFKMLNGEIPSEKQMAIIEAHEKGHLIRDYMGRSSNGYFFDKYFSSGFDISKIEINEDRYKEIEKLFETQGHNIIKNEPELEDYEKAFANVFQEDTHTVHNQITPEEVKEKFIKGLFTGIEISERMSQLKNYFGFDGNQTFTKKHLDYARSNYIKDTGSDNGMDEFFQAITPEKEERFLYLINNSGI
jgi:hypothetical protein